MLCTGAQKLVSRLSFARSLMPVMLTFLAVVIIIVIIIIITTTICFSNY